MTAPPRMQVVRSRQALRRRVRAWRRAGLRVAFVPTMGSLHEGHLSLLRRARRLGDRVVLSIFVNPTQFSPREDFGAYPRNLPRDLRLARGVPVDLCFTPPVEAMYAQDSRTEVRVTCLDRVLEGSTRPAHFAGVALVVLKLLHLVEPDLLILGQKDAQQALILERMVRDLDVPVKVVRGPTVRERDGLAMSSRNAFLSPEDRAAAAALWRSLRHARDLVRSGERRSSRVLAAVRADLAQEPRIRLDYAAAVDARTLEPLTRLEGRVLFPLAAYLGRTRLIDNLEIHVPGGRR